MTERVSDKSRKPQDWNDLSDAEKLKDFTSSAVEMMALKTKSQDLREELSLASNVIQTMNVPAGPNKTESIHAWITRLRQAQRVYDAFIERKDAP